MNKLTKAKTIGMILLAALLLAVPSGIVFGETGNGQVGVPNIGESEISQPIPEDLPPLLMVDWRATGEYYICPDCGPIAMYEVVTIYCESERWPVVWSLVGWRATGEYYITPEGCRIAMYEPVASREPPLTTDGPPPAHYAAAEWVDGRWVEVSPYRDKTQGPDDDVGIAAITSGVDRPYRSGLNAHGRAWTRAHYESGVRTVVRVWVALRWWDDANDRWVTVGWDFDCESTACWRGLITARGLAIDFDASTGRYRVESLHHVYVDGRRVYNRPRQSPERLLTFP